MNALKVQIIEFGIAKKFPADIIFMKSNWGEKLRTVACLAYKLSLRNT